MRSIFIAFTIAALLGITVTANAWLGDSPDALIQRYGKPKLVELTTGDIPTQKGYYVELKENYSTNVNLLASTDANYNEIGYGMDLVETRSRYTFEKDGLSIVAYVGNIGEKYNGTDFAGRSAREIIHCGTVWEKNKSGDKFAQPGGHFLRRWTRRRWLGLAQQLRRQRAGTPQPLANDTRLRP